MRSALVALLAASLVASPIATTAANAASAAPLSLANVPGARAGAPMQDASNVEGVAWWVWAGLAVAAIVLIIVIADDNNNNDSNSP